MGLAPPVWESGLEAIPQPLPCAPGEQAAVLSLVWMLLQNDRQKTLRLFLVTEGPCPRILVISQKSQRKMAQHPFPSNLFVLLLTRDLQETLSLPHPTNV